MQWSPWTSRAAPSTTPRMSPSGHARRQERLPMQTSGSMTGCSERGRCPPRADRSPSVASSRRCRTTRRARWPPARSPTARREPATIHAEAGSMEGEPAPRSRGTSRPSKYRDRVRPRKRLLRGCARQRPAVKAALRRVLTAAAPARPRARPRRLTSDPRPLLKMASAIADTARDAGRPRAKGPPGCASRTTSRSSSATRRSCGSTASWTARARPSPRSSRASTRALR